MTLSKSIIVAKADLKMAIKVRYVKYGLITMGAMGPIFTILMIALPMTMILDPSEAEFLLAIMMPYAGSMLAMFSVIPAAMISANSFVGEREQKTLEPLLCTPLTDSELLVGKTLGALIPSLALLFGGTAAAALGTNIILLFNGLPMIMVPDAPGLFLVLAVGPIGALAVISVMILISGRVSKVYEAYQTSGAMVVLFMIPMVLPMTAMEGTASDVLAAAWFANFITFLIVAAVALVTWALAWSQFNRDKMVRMV